MKSHFELVVNKDPLKLNKYGKDRVKPIYTVCVMIPALLGFSLVFFLIFFMSPRSGNMRQYQRDIFEWNKDDLAKKMTSLDLLYEVLPSIDKGHAVGPQGLQHYTIPSTEEEDEIALSNFYSYDHSFYLTDSIFKGFKSFSYSTSHSEVPLSPIYCIHPSWKLKSHSKLNHASIEDLPVCDAKNETGHHWPKTSTWTGGVSFPLYKEQMIDIFCINATCAQKCADEHNGIFKDGQCYIFEVLNRLCITLSLSEGEKSNEVSDVSLNGGCYENSDVGYYVPALPDTTYNFQNVSFSIRSMYDPYTVFEESEYNLGRDLTIFFWASIISVALAGLLILVLFCCYCSFMRYEQSLEENQKFRNHDGQLEESP